LIHQLEVSWGSLQTALQERISLAPAQKFKQLLIISPKSRTSQVTTVAVLDEVIWETSPSSFTAENPGNHFGVIVAGHFLVTLYQLPT
jgi:hypothetical protein